MSTPDGTPPAPVPWHVLGDQITEDTQLLPGMGGLQMVYKVPYQIDDGPARGHTGIIRVAPADYTPDNLRRLIDAQVTTTHNVASLGTPRA